MKQFANYFILGFSALLPLINPPGSALELLGVVGVGQDKPYKFLAKKIAINTTLFLAVVALTGPYVLQFFGISVDVLQAVGGAVLAAMGWNLLNKPAGEKQMSDPNLHTAAQDSLANFWQSKVFYPFTFPITVGPGSVAVMLTLSAQAKSLQFSDRIDAFLGLFGCVALLSLMVFVFYAYAPSTAQKVPSALAQGVLRIIAFLLICIGVQIAWHGLRIAVCVGGSLISARTREGVCKKHGIEMPSKDSEDSREGELRTRRQGYAAVKRNGYLNHWAAEYLVRAVH